MARISYDDQTAAAYKAVREIPRDGLSDWREAVRRQLRPSPGMTVVDVADKEDARMWAGKIAEACGWPQEVRRFKPMPQVS